MEHAANINETENENHFAGLSLSSLSKEWDTTEDEVWDALLSQMTPIL